MRSRSAAFPVRKRATCCTALEMADGDAWALIYSFGVSILRQTPRILTRRMCHAAHDSKNHDSVLAHIRCQANRHKPFANRRMKFYARAITETQRARCRAALKDRTSSVRSKFRSTCSRTPSAVTAGGYGRRILIPITSRSRWASCRGGHSTV
jgi:hypothetical protein